MRSPISGGIEDCKKLLHKLRSVKEDSPDISLGIVPFNFRASRETLLTVLFTHVMPRQDAAQGSATGMSVLESHAHSGRAFSTSVLLISEQRAVPSDLLIPWQDDNRREIAENRVRYQSLIVTLGFRIERCEL